MSNFVPNGRRDHLLDPCRVLRRNSVEIPACVRAFDRVHLVCACALYVVPILGSYALLGVEIVSKFVRVTATNLTEVC